MYMCMSFEMKADKHISTHRHTLTRVCLLLYGAKLRRQVE